MVRIFTKASFLPSMTVWGGRTVIAVPFRTKRMHGTSLNLSLPEWIMEFCNVALTFGSVGEVASCFSKFYKMKLLFSLSHFARLTTFGSEMFNWGAVSAQSEQRKSGFMQAQKLYKSNKNQPSATTSNENKMVHVETTYSFSNTFQHNIF